MKMLNKNGNGILWMIMSCIWAALMINTIRYLSAELHVLQIVFFRYVFAVIFFLPLLLPKGLAVFKTDQLRWHFLRGIIGACGMYAWFYSLTIMNLATATALSFTAPLITAVLSAIIFGERYGYRRTAALLLGFIGTLIVLRPGADAFNITGLIVIGAACFWAMSGIIIKKLSSKDDPLLIAFYMILLILPFTLFPALSVWQWPSNNAWFWLAVLGLCSNLFQISLTRAIANGEFAVILPFDFLRLIFVSILAYIVFGQVLDFWTAIGASVIMASTAYTAYREARLKKQHAAMESHT